MSLRSICVLSISKEDCGKVLHYRTFPTVEKRCKILHGDKYIPIPSPQVFVKSLLVKLSLTPDAKQFVERRDKCCGTMQLPVIEIHTGKHEIWPVVAVAQNSFLVCCLPLVENVIEKRGNLLQIPSVSVGFSVILGILNFINSAPNAEHKISRFMELDNFLTLNMPFGTPSDVELSSASYIYNFQTPQYLKKQPAWKPFDYKGKQQIHFSILEFVRCMQSDQAGNICHFEIFGQVMVKADLEGALNTVSISVSSSDPARPLLLDSLVIHPCVEVHCDPSSPASSLLRRLRFSPPLHEFILFHYCSPEPKQPPVQGVFKMLGENPVELLVQLKLNEYMKNNFEFFDVIIAFFNRGPVKSIDFNINCGAPKLSEDKHTLKWSIGAKFPKDLEAVITAKLEFYDKPILRNSDPFCVDRNCYAQINFKQNNTNLSGCVIDPKNVTLSQMSKAKIIIDRNIQSAEYRIWNMYGDLPFPVNISNKCKKLFN